MKKHLLTFIALLLSVSLAHTVSCKKDKDRINDPVNNSSGQIRLLLMVNCLSKINPLGPFFFHKLIRYTKTAASALNIQLKEVVYNFDDPETTRKIESTIRTTKPDGILILPFGLKEETLNKMNRFLVDNVLNSRIPLISIHNKITGLGKPGETPYYIGQVIPDDSTSGYLLASELIRQARKKKKGKLKIVGLSASLYDPASLTRIEGLKKAAMEDGNSVIQQIFPIKHYSPAIAMEKAALILKDRYPDTDIVWCSSDSIAKGVFEAIKGSRTNSNYIIGGIDWSPWAIEALQRGDIHATVGGHCYDGARAVILMYDYLNGHDFKSETTKFSIKMEVLTADDRDAGAVHDTGRLHRIIPFLTKTHNPAISTYRFDSRSIISGFSHLSKTGPASRRIQKQ